MADIYIAIGTIAAALVAIFSLLYMIFIRPSKEKFDVVFDRLHEHDLTIATVPGMATDMKDIKNNVHELTNRFSNLAQAVARIEGKLGCKEDE